jgi:hypothetical protein
MSSRRILALSLVIASFALPVLAKDVLLVIVDRQNQRAYIPEGSVIPQGMTIRAGALPPQTAAEIETTRRAGARNRADFLDLILKRPSGTPLVFEYAPAERFTQVRQRYEAQHPQRPANGRTLVANYLSCSPAVYLTDSPRGYYGTYYHGFTSYFCSQTTPCNVNDYCEWGFIAEADSTDDDSYVYPYAAVYDQNNNYPCTHVAYGYESPLSCSASNTTQFRQVGFLNEVHTVAQVYTIEYLENYEPYYLGSWFDVGYGTFFY